MSDTQGYKALADAQTGAAERQTGVDALPGARPADGRPTGDSFGAAPAPRPGFFRRARTPLLIAGPLVAIVAVVFVYLTGGRYQSTDDAYIRAARVDISTNIAGRVIELAVHDNQRVRKGDLLFRLDAQPTQVAAEQSAAELTSAQQGVTGARATYQQRTVEVAAAKVTLAYQQKELAREQAMTASGVTSKAQLDAQVQAVAVAKANLAAAGQAQANALSALGSTPDGKSANNPAVRQAQAALDRARLNLSYAVIRAPQDGTVTKVDQLQVGDYVNAAQPVFSLVAPRVWVEANFKEDQLTHMRIGQRATFKVDAYPGTKFTGYVQSLSPGTGSAFSLLPAENANGNWVKVVQRLPVRIAIDNPPEDLPLHSGLSVNVSVDTEHHRQLFGGKQTTRTVTTTRTTQERRAG